MKGRISLAGLVRILGAMLIAFVVFGVIWPNLAVSSWTSDIPPRRLYQPNASATATLLGMVLIPVVCIVVGEMGRKIVADVGWLLLFLAFAVMLTKSA